MNIYETEPAQISIAQTAWDEYLRFKGDRSDKEATRLLMTQHIAHAHAQIAEDRLCAPMGVLLVTDIPDYDLAVMICSLAST